MIIQWLQLSFFERRKDYGVVFLRLLIGIFIIYGVQDNVFSPEHMREFAGFLDKRGVPYPFFSACVSAYVQFVCGLSILFGAFVRLAAIPFIINFIAAIVIAHLGDSFRGMFPALMMVAAGFFFLFYRPWKLSIDQLFVDRQPRSA